MKESFGSINPSVVGGISQLMRHFIKGVAPLNSQTIDPFKGVGLWQFRSCGLPCLWVITKEFSHSGATFLSRLIVIPSCSI